jgi:uncharacterized protein (DUF1778 family)
LNSKKVKRSMVAEQGASTERSRGSTELRRTSEVQRLITLAAAASGSPFSPNKVRLTLHQRLLKDDYFLDLRLHQSNRFLLPQRLSENVNDF